MIIIHAHIKVAAQHRDEFLQKAQSVLAGSQAEEGNIIYRLCEDAQEPNSFIMVEQWKDQQAIEFHRQTPHFIQFGNDTKGLLAAPVRADIFEVVDR
ncbi:MAG: putative quinol monooxygenase [Tumebacillaceae bacterium]